MKDKLIQLLRWSERYTKTDMVYMASGAFWGNLNGLFLAFLSLVTSILFARFLTKEAFGTYQYVLAIGGLITAITLTGMNTAVTRAVARGFEGDYKKSVKYQLKFGIIAMLVSFAIAGWYYTKGNTDLGLSFLWIGLFMPAANALNTWAAYMGGKKFFKIGTRYGFINMSVTYIGIIVVLYVTQSFVWVIFANFFFGLLSNIIIYFLIARRFEINDATDPETIPYGNHLTVMAIPGFIATQIDALLIFQFIGPAPLAVYSFATIIPEKLAGMLKFIPNIALPKLSEKTPKEVGQILFKRIWVILAFLGLIAFAYAELAPFFFKIFFPQYTASVPYTQIYALSFFSVGAVFVQTALVSQQKVKELYIVNTSMPFLKTILLVVLMYFYGIWGILWAQIIIHIISIPLQLYLYKRSLMILYSHEK
ncbi:MAG: oligosaccharide flippase family protein [bacterium]|nr:oligosaccharide flippase family protein [bacterium]